ncbi:hypothetical protein V5O48_008991 [Marasmius crinis-equi]|uniref:Uncharacterized protein n=1 Tax=Marasmius crinis-equi TaxID=585013 RepID=A0ABR3FCL5_9AGAR
MNSPNRRPRPWSPDPNDPLPSLNVSRHHVPNEASGYDFDFEYSRYPSAGPSSAHSHSNHNHINTYEQHAIPPRRDRQERREPSDVSVEALDLADYARTLQRNHTPHSHRERERGYVPDNMLDSLHPPSLTYSSGGSDVSSSRNSRQNRRPFSLPPSSSYSLPQSRHHQHPNHEPDFLAPGDEEQEIDISRFPAWSRGWYNGRSNPSSPPDIYSPLPHSQFDSVRMGKGTGRTRHKSNQNPYDWDPYSTNNRSLGSQNYWNDPPPPSSFSHTNESTRELLPWNRHNHNDSLDIDPALKEERIRMLEREFGPNSTSGSAPKQDPNSPYLLDDSGKPLIGTVDPRSGAIVTQGPRKRLAVRVLEVVFAGVAAVPSIYAAVSIKTGTGTGGSGTDAKDEKPPPQGTVQAYVLYVMSVVWLVGLLVLFVFYPCCCRRRKVKGAKDGMGMGMGPGGMMVLPVFAGVGGGKNGKKKKGKKGKHKGPGGEGGDVQVNLIVDPAMFGGRRHEDEDDPSEDEYPYEEFGTGGSSASMPGGYAGQRKKRKPRRRNLFVGLQMEEEWKRARGYMKKVTAVDVLGVVVWGAVFVLILLGKRCPIGGFNGWCNAYNTSSAAACLLCIAFGVSVFFDIKDLHASKESPRTRT